MYEIWIEGIKQPFVKTDIPPLATDIFNRIKESITDRVWFVVKCGEMQVWAGHSRRPR